MQLFREIEKSFPQMEKFFTAAAKKEFTACKLEDLCDYHFGFGTWIRNHLLRNGSALLEYFTQVGINDRDEMSAIMIFLFYLPQASDGAA